jgi:hypothetical protein
MPAYLTCAACGCRVRIRDEFLGTGQALCCPRCKYKVTGGAPPSLPSGPSSATAVAGSSPYRLPPPPQRQPPLPQRAARQSESGAGGQDGEFRAFAGIWKGLPPARNCWTRLDVSPAFVYFFKNLCGPGRFVAL